MSSQTQDILQQREVEEILQNDLKTDFKLVSYSVKPASENLSGFLGEHYKIFIEVDVDGNRKKVQYFLKRIPSKVPEHREYAEKTKAFYKEIELYKTVFVDLENAQRNVKGATKWCPKYFYSRGCELFVLEDLSLQGYYMYPERIVMDEEHIKASLKAMAAMHAASFIFEEKLNEGKVECCCPGFERVPGKRVSLGEIYSHLTFETEASDEKGHPGNTYHEAGIKSQLDLVRILPDYTEEEKRIIIEKLPDVLRYSLQLVKTSNRFKNVFLHGDLWSNNLLFSKDESGKVKQALIIDFQLARYAPPAHDLMMFFHLALDADYFENNRSRFYDYYYRAFSEELLKSGYTAQALLPWPTFLESCSFYNDLGLICKLFYFQLSLAPPEVGQKFLSTPELFTQNMLTDRSEMVMECFLKDDICKTRVTRAIQDVVKTFILKSS